MKHTWEDIERAAIGDPRANITSLIDSPGDPLLYAAATLVAMGHSKEEVLIEVALALAAENKALRASILEYLNTMPRPPLMITERDI